MYSFPDILRCLIFAEFDKTGSLIVFRAFLYRLRTQLVTLVMPSKLIALLNWILLCSKVLGMFCRIFLFNYKFFIHVGEFNFKRRLRGRKNPQSIVPDVALVLLKSNSVRSGCIDEAKNWTLIKYTARVKERDVNLNLMVDPGVYYLIPVSFSYFTSDGQSFVT